MQATARKANDLDYLDQYDHGQIKKVLVDVTKPEEIHFVPGSNEAPGSNEVVPDLASQYEDHLRQTGQDKELDRFTHVKDYRNRRHAW